MSPFESSIKATVSISKSIVLNQTSDPRTFEQNYEKKTNLLYTFKFGFVESHKD